MLTTSRYMNGGAPKCCAHCSEPFPMVDNHFRAWHGQDGKYYCQEDCEADASEAAARRRKVLA